MKKKRIKRLIKILPKKSGRDTQGHVVVRHQGGRHKRFLRIIDWKRDKENIPAKVLVIEYDPNRSANVALLQYSDGEKRYILAPAGLRIGQKVVSGDKVDIKTGNALKLGLMPVGTVVHNVEIIPGRGAQMIRGAGVGAAVLAKDDNMVHLKLPSGEIRMFPAQSKATVGQVGNIDWRNRIIGKAGRNRHLGKRPQVRGVAQNPKTHPHGGGEGRSGIGLPSPKTPWGKPTLGKKTRKRKKYSNKLIVKRR